MRTYSELRRLNTLKERFDYLQLKGAVGCETFGSSRWVNQTFYQSTAWRQVRSAVITRDNGCDLGVPGFEIYKGLYIHHMNPLTLEHIQDGDESILDPEYLITVSLKTHNAIHYGNDELLPAVPIQRRPGDTKLW